MVNKKIRRREARHVAEAPAPAKKTARKAPTKKAAAKKAAGSDG